jgi:hypothetical protein
MCINEPEFADRLLTAHHHLKTVIYLLRNGDLRTSHVRTEAGPFSETSCSIDFRVPADGQSKKKSNSGYVLI